MPSAPVSGTRYLLKRHRNCSNAGELQRCGCPWRGRYKGKEVVLAKWSGEKLDPRSKVKAKEVLRRFLTAVDEKRFDPAGEQPALGSDDSLKAFIKVWELRHAEKRGLSGYSPDDEPSKGSLRSMLDVISTGKLGGYTLEELAGSSEMIEDWLNATGKARKWSNKTWNGYRDLLGRIFKKAMQWKANGKARMIVNPMVDVERRVARVPEHFKQRHLVEDVEDRLFAVVDQLNRPQHKANRSKLTQEQADAIRAALAAGETGTVVASRFGVSATVVSQIKYGEIWNPERIKVGTKGTEMRRRLIAAFDGGLRAGEMQQIQLCHVRWTPVRGTTLKGEETVGYELALPPEITKGGKRTGKTEYVFAGTPRFRALLEARRFQLQGNPPSRQFIFGTEDGRYQKGFRSRWRDLFTLAGLRWGRDHGLTWHTTRHEYISRLAEKTGDPVLTQSLARHQELETTQGYFHARRERQLAAAASLHRG